MVIALLALGNGNTAAVMSMVEYTRNPINIANRRDLFRTNKTKFLYDDGDP